MAISVEVLEEWLNPFLSQFPTDKLIIFHIMAGTGKGGVFTAFPDARAGTGGKGAATGYDASDFLPGGQGFGEGEEPGFVAPEAAHIPPQRFANAPQFGGTGKGQGKIPTQPPYEGTTSEQPGQASTGRGGVSAACSAC